MPLDIGIWSHRTGLARTIGVNQRDRDDITIGNGMGIGDGQRILQDGLDGTPDVNYLESSLEELGCLVWKMIRHAASGCAVRLIDMNALDGSTQLCSRSIRVFGRTTDGMIEDYNFRGAGAGAVREGDHECRHEARLTHLLRAAPLRIVFALDLLIIEKLFLLAFVIVELKSTVVKRVVKLTAADVVNGHWDCL